MMSRRFVCVRVFNNNFGHGNSEWQPFEKEQTINSICCLNICVFVISTFCFECRTSVHIRITCPCNVYPLTPHFYIVKLGFAGVYIFSYFCS